MADQPHTTDVPTSPWASLLVVLAIMIIAVCGVILGWWTMAVTLAGWAIGAFMEHWTTIWQLLVLWKLLFISNRLQR